MGPSIASLMQQRWDWNSALLMQPPLLRLGALSPMPDGRRCLPRVPSVPCAIFVYSIRTYSNPTPYPHIFARPCAGSSTSIGKRSVVSLWHDYLWVRLRWSTSILLSPTSINTRISFRNHDTSLMCCSIELQTKFKNILTPNKQAAGRCEPPQPQPLCVRRGRG